MCGIVGGVAQRNVLPILLEGLRRLEYRGYDSAGVALLEADEIARVRSVGKVATLQEKLEQHPVSGQIGIAHTRWATHGVPSEVNAHPHMSGVPSVAVVHNGIIENYQSLKAELIEAGVAFSSETDTEVIAHLIAQALTKTKSLCEAVQSIVPKLKGAYGLVVMAQQYPDVLVAVRSGSPLVIGLGIEENFLASDCLSLLPVTQRFIYLEEGDVAEVTIDAVRIMDATGRPVERPIDENTQSADAASKGPYKHFMLKEMYEQPDAVTNTMANSINAEGRVVAQAFGAQAETVMPKVKRVRIVACGTSYHAGLVAKYWLEQWAGIGCDVDIASELRYRQAVVEPDTLFVTVSQSGETADTLAALRAAKEQGYLSTLSICNVGTSSLVRESELVFLTHAGVEMGVASTKAFTAQLTALYLLTCLLVQQQQQPNIAVDTLTQALQQVPSLMKSALTLAPSIEQLARQYIEKHSALFLGRGVHYPIALEGALKLKEISYIHAEGYPAGELKHGPLALVDQDMPVITIVPNDAQLDKLVSNLQEVQAREGELIIFTEQSIKEAMPEGAHCIVLPDIPAIVAPIVFTVPLQLFSYFVAVLKGTDVDQPRNLAKSVTVE